MALHPWWAAFGLPVTAADELPVPSARVFAKAVEGAGLPGITLIDLKHAPESGRAVVHIEVEVERPQDLAYPIRSVEPIAVVFEQRNIRPSILALREDFPDTMHQNGVPPDTPCALCVDDRPWPEASLTYTPAEFVRHIQLWLAKAARGELHDPAQPPDPMFFGSGLSLVLPTAALTQQGEPAEFVGVMRNDNGSLIIARPVAEAPQGIVGFTVIAFALQPQEMTRMRHAPNTLSGLNVELERFGVHLVDEIKSRIKDWAAVNGPNLRRLDARLAIVIAMPVTARAGRAANDFRAFVSYESAGQIGVAMGVIHKNMVGGGYVRAITPAPVISHVSKVEPAQVHFAFDRNLAASIAGHSAADRRKALLVGAGSFGSQLALDLAREGRFVWTTVDNDVLLPHNMARHGLPASEIGAPKAPALARQIQALLNEPCTNIICDVIDPDPASAARLATAYAEADVIIDASASVGVSRHLSDVTTGVARRVCVFFNPSGTSAVLLVESADRSITLRDLEAQYHRLVLTEATLAIHLQTERDGVRYSGSCRALTNRIPATRAAILSGLAARGLADCLENTGAEIRIWQLEDLGQVSVVRQLASPVRRTSFSGWTITYDEALMVRLSDLRGSKLPNETGGVLLGIADMSRQSIHIAHAMEEPLDSNGTPTRFERGVAGLVGDIRKAAQRTLHQVRYIGEWHSHPEFASAMPSGTDLAQIAWLGREIAQDGLPGLMAIAASKGDFTIVGYDPAQCATQGIIKVSIRHARL